MYLTDMSRSPQSAAQGRDVKICLISSNEKVPGRKKEEKMIAFFFPHIYILEERKLISPLGKS